MIARGSTRSSTRGRPGLGELISAIACPNRSSADGGRALVVGRLDRGRGSGWWVDAPNRGLRRTRAGTSGGVVASLPSSLVAQAGIRVQLHSPEGLGGLPKGDECHGHAGRHNLLVAAQPHPRGSQRRSARSPGTSGGPDLLGPAASRMVKTDSQAHLRTSHPDEENSPDTYDSSRRSSTRSQMNREDGRRECHSSRTPPSREKSLRGRQSAAPQVYPCILTQVLLGRVLRCSRQPHLGREILSDKILTYLTLHRRPTQQSCRAFLALLGSEPLTRRLVQRQGSTNHFQDVL